MEKHSNYYKIDSKTSVFSLNLKEVWHIFINKTENGVQTLIHYPIPPHKQEAYKKWNDLSFPITEKIHQEVLSLPISSMMSDNEVREVITAINKYV